VAVSGAKWVQVRPDRSSNPLNAVPAMDLETKYGAAISFA